MLTGVGVVFLAGRLARRLGGETAESAAALLAATFPPLVIRSAIAAQDMVATCFGLAALLFALRAREAEFATRDSLLAGIACGLAIASKLPAGLAALPAGLMVLTAPRSLRVRVQLTSLLTLGTVATAPAASPPFIFRTRAVLAELRGIAGYVRDLQFPTFFEQAFQRAEQDLPLDYPEIGWLFLMVTLIAVISALADRRKRTVVLIWLMYAACLIGFHSCFAFQPFRYLISLMPLMCVLVGCMWAKCRSLKLTRPWILDAAAVALVFFLFGLPLKSYLLDRMNCIDSRVEVVNWLAMHTQPLDTVLVARELTILPMELDHIPARVVLADRTKGFSQAADTGIRYVVTGRLTQTDRREIPPEAEAALAMDYRLKAQFGETPTPHDPGIWRGNRETLLIFQLVPAGQGK